MSRRIIFYREHQVDLREKALKSIYSFLLFVDDPKNAEHEKHKQACLSPKLEEVEIDHEGFLARCFLVIRLIAILLHSFPSSLIVRTLVTVIQIKSVCSGLGRNFILDLVLNIRFW
uniref:Uncharacterized protein n=1 Tax=Nelumbo nucifera TaxID=4432 RepID=A0A822ZRK4_NELNU|nr:TPA_asm: hypothetical protein HUJ06_017057 [Nelumbo nucifera]